eukprot:6287635-Pyramimonas_sp.AAC.1
MGGLGGLVRAAALEAPALHARVVTSDKSGRRGALTARRVAGASHTAGSDQGQQASPYESRICHGSPHAARLARATVDVRPRVRSDAQTAQAALVTGGL